MNKKGFTLIELLAVIALIAVVSVIVFYSVKGVEAGINKYMWCRKVDLIENAAVRWGEDHKSIISSEQTIEVQQLFGRYLVADKCKDENNQDQNCIKNEIDNDIVNESTITILIDKNLVYAKYDDKDKYNCK